VKEKIQYLGDLQRLEIRPGDRFVITTDKSLTMDAVHRIQEEWMKFAGDDAKTAKLLILTDGMKIGAISPTPSKDP
jgi:hypothetical protein